MDTSPREGLLSTQLLLEEFQKMRRKNQLCDITVTAGDVSLPAHKCLLAARSKNLLTALLHDQEVNIIIDTINSDHLEPFLDFLYTGQLDNRDLTVRTVLHILRAAKQYNVNVDENIVAFFIQRNLSISNVKELFEMTRELDVPELHSLVVHFVATRIDQLSCTDELNSVSLDDLVDVIKCEESAQTPLSEVASAVISWCVYDAECRLGYMMHLLSLISLPSNAVDIIFNEICSFGNPSHHTADDIFEIATRVISLESARENATGTPIDGRSLVVITGGESDNGETGDKLILFDPRSNQTINYTASLPAKLLDHGVTFMNGKLYVAGGQRISNAKMQNSTNDLYAYDIANNTWAILPSMQRERAVFSLSQLKGKLFAIGGKNRQGSVASVEVFDPRTNVWSYVAHMYTGMFGHASTAYKGTLYVSGGVVAGRHFTYSLQTYQSKTNRWVQMSPMIHKRAFHNMCVVRDHLYVVGGNTHDDMHHRVDCESVERYNPKTDNWTHIMSMPRPVSLSGAIAFEGSIYVIGGYSGKRGEKRKEVQRFNVQRRQWSIVNDLPMSVIRMGVALNQLS